MTCERIDLEIGVVIVGALLFATGLVVVLDSHPWSFNILCGSLILAAGAILVVATLMYEAAHSPPSSPPPSPSPSPPPPIYEDDPVIDE